MSITIFKDLTSKKKKDKDVYQIAKSPKIDVYLNPDENVKTNKILRGSKFMPFFDMEKNEGIRCLLSEIGRAHV